jgi:transposase InsO family protein
MIGYEGGMPGPHRASAMGTRVASQREVARRLGISHTALQKAQRTGRIAPEPDGAWDVARVRARLAESSDPTRKTASLAHPVLPTTAPLAPRHASVGEPETTGVIERLFRTFKERVVHGRFFQTIDEAREAVRDFAARYNAEWLIEKNGYLSLLDARAARLDTNLRRAAECNQVSREPGAVQTKHLRLVAFMAAP